MSFAALLNRTCSWKRASVASTTNDWGENIASYAVVSSDRPCRLESLYDRELVEAVASGEHDKGIYVLYLGIGENIRAGDIVTIDGDVADFQYNAASDTNELIISDVEDAGGGRHNHLQCFCRYRKAIE